MGIETSDDAAIYKVTDEIAMIQTVDFFTPIVDDPYMFGQIAAANSLSDMWAMGGEPAVALNIVGFPNCLDPAILGDILAGGADKVKEAGRYWWEAIPCRMTNRSMVCAYPALCIRIRFLRISGAGRGMCWC